MDLAARVHALEILVETLIETLPAERRTELAQLFARRAEIAKEASQRLPIEESRRVAIAQQLDRLSENLAQIAKRSY